MPLPPLPKTMGSILKEGEMTVKASSNPKSLKTEIVTLKGCGMLPWKRRYCKRYFIFIEK